MSSRPGISSPSRLEALTRPLSCLLEPFSRRRCIIALSLPGSPPEAARAPPVKVVSKCALAGSPRPPSQARIEPASPGRRSLSLSGSFSGEKSFEKFPAYIKAAPPRSMVPHGLQLLEGGAYPRFGFALFSVRFSGGSGAYRLERFEYPLPQFPGDFRGSVARSAWFGL